MSLIAEVQARIPSQTLLGWTNQQNTAATTVDTDYLLLVCDDVESDIEVEMGYDYQGENVPIRDKRWQVSQAILGVMIRLEWYTSLSSSDVERKYQNWITALQRRRRRATITPTTGAKADIELEDPSKRTDFDRRDQAGWLADKKGRSSAISNPGIGD